MLSEKIDNDFKQAMKDKNPVKVSTLSLLRSQFKYVMIEKKAEKIEDIDVIAVIKKQIKQRQDSIEQYEKGGRQDLADKEKEEYAILKAYLPAEMSFGDIEKIVSEIVKETGAQGMKDMGKVMKDVAPRLAGRADNKMVSEAVKKILSGQ
ncbi:MAG: GatB/YqeY domain-containing protein [Candidatus Omnitrophica bacterium]|nr:GatB/YqeY domain-containing protein [Candidatus Omnitrophota bacterium]